MSTDLVRPTPKRQSQRQIWSPFSRRLTIAWAHDRFATTPLSISRVGARCPISLRNTFGARITDQPTAQRWCIVHPGDSRHPAEFGIRCFCRTFDRLHAFQHAFGLRLRHILLPEGRKRIEAPGNARSSFRISLDESEICVAYLPYHKAVLQLLRCLHTVWNPHLAWRRFHSNNTAVVIAQDFSMRSAFVASRFCVW